MTEQKDLIQDFATVASENLLGRVLDLKGQGYRLGQACATMIADGVEVLYSFVRDNAVKNLKVTLDDKAPEIQSVTAIFGYAFIYENEMHDLFGIKFKNLSLDYGGKFFKLSEATPWNPALAKEDAQ